MGFDNVQKAYALNFLKNLFFFGAITVPFFIDWIRVDYTKMFVLQAWFTFWVFALEIPTGVVADRYGRRNSIALGAFFLSAGLFVYGMAAGYEILFLAEFLGALGIALISGADKALIYDSLIEMKRQKDARHFFARYETAGTVGMLVAFPAGSLFARSGIVAYPASLPVTFLLTGIAGLIAVLVALTMNEPKRKREVENFVESGFEGMRYLLRHKKLRELTLNFSLISAATFFMFWFYQPIAQNAGIDIAYFGLIAAGFNLFGALLLMKLKWLEKKFGLLEIVFYTALLPGLLFIGVSLTNSLWLVVPAIFVIAGSKFLRAPILSDFMNRHIESRNRATVLSAAFMIEKAAIAIMYPIVGLLADVSLGYALAGLGVLSLAFAFVTKLEAEHLG